LQVSVLIVGGLIASALPRSDLEDEFVGNASSAVKRRAQAAASQGFRFGAYRS